MRDKGFTIELTVSTERGAGAHRVAAMGSWVASLIPPVFGPARSLRRRISRGRRRCAGSSELFLSSSITA
ncbi:MAG: hypothetical protein IH627_15935 [Rubrivivax sp.]|nr:hypothetical protein [Rubrivivax sp.]